MRAGDAERKIRQRGEESGGTEIATAHYHHLYLSGCRTSNYCCHIAHNEGKHDVCADVFVYIFMYRISFPTFLSFFFFLCCLYKTVSAHSSRYVTAPYFFMCSCQSARVCERVYACVCVSCVLVWRLYLSR